MMVRSAFLSSAGGAGESGGANDVGISRSLDVQHEILEPHRDSFH
jgi:hypothetical protein